MPRDVSRRRVLAAAGSSLFFALAPGMVAGVGPWWLTRWDVREPPYPPFLRILGTAMLAAGVAVMVHAFVRFVVEATATSLAA